MAAAKREMKEKLTTRLCMAGLIALLYPASYFALVRPGVTISMGGKRASWPAYFGLPDSVEIWFQPLHAFDRVYLRSGLWEGTVPPDEQVLAAEAAIKAAKMAREQQ